MTILTVAYPLLAAGPDAAGGAEQVLYLLERGLVAAGHRSIVIAARGSQVSGELIATPVLGEDLAETERPAAQAEHLRSIRAALHSHNVDLIHFHGLDFHTYVPCETVAKLATLHLPPAWYPSWIFHSANLHSANLNLNCVSDHQAAVSPGDTKLAVVRNGVDVEKFGAPGSSRGFLLWIGRICPEKGVHVALEVARSAGLPAIVAGPVHPFPEHERYFTECVEPLLDRERQYIGPVGLQRKAELLAQAACLLIPSLVAETSSLVAMEAISSGTPVIALGNGALPEVVDHGTTGFIVNSQAAMVAALGRVGELSRERCREIGRRRFDAARMVRDYLKLYDSLLT